MLLASVIALAFTAAAPPPDIFKEIDRVELLREEKLAGYTVTERYRVTNSHFKEPAEMLVHTVYKRGEGKTYTVVSRSGPDFLQTKVLDKILASEHEMSQGKARSAALMTSANYDFKVVGQETVDGRECQVITLNPKAKSQFLIRGKAWLDAKSFILVKLEGKPTQSPSFFAGSPFIQRQYEEADGFALARQSKATTQGFLLGSTEILIQYSDYKLVD